jgi:endonuclease/exonuclease/phosphatase family metal-dependent hydrolase
LAAIAGRSAATTLIGIRWVTDNFADVRTRSKRPMIKYTALLVVLAFAAGLSGSQPASAQLGQGNGDLRVMTYNVDEGTDYIEVTQATNTTEFLIGVGKTISQVRATKPPERMEALASQIIAASPALVSLQELDQWFTGSFDPTTRTCGSVALEFDLLQELLSSLAAQGAFYEVVVQGRQFAIPPTPGLILPSTFLCVQVINQVALLARTDLDPSKFQWANAQSAQYANILYINTPAGPVPEPRAWVSVDANFHGNVFRFIGTHLDSFDPDIRRLQGGELRAGPANTSLPVIIAMDSNAQAAPPPQDATYTDFLAAGYKDAWSQIFRVAPGFTCCQAQFVNNPVSQLSQRIDLILTMGNVQTQNIALFGADPSDRTSGGLWPSDHAGVAAQLLVRETAGQ